MERLFNELTWAIRNGHSVQKYLIDCNLMDDKEIRMVAKTGFNDIASFLKDAFWVRQNTLPGYNFDQSGNLSFGISDYTDFPDQKYDPDIGIFGMDINIVLERPGHRVSRRRRRNSRVARTHRVVREECKQWFVDNYDIIIVEE